MLVRVEAIGTGLLRVVAAASADTPMASGADRHGRSLICISPSCAGRPTADRAGDTPAIVHRAMAAPVRATVAEGERPAMEAAVALRAVVDMSEVADIRVAAEVAATLVEAAATADTANLEL